MPNTENTTSEDAPARIAVVGTRGVPGRYGGFETLAEQLARHIDASRTRLTIYGQRSAYSPAERAGPFHGHDRSWLPFSASGAQSIVHDGLQLFQAVFRHRHTHILLLGTSAAWLLPVVRVAAPLTRIVTNVDGLEWRRDKFGPLGRGVLKWLEAIAVRFSDLIIADNDALVPIVRELHGVEPAMIAYGGDHVAPAPKAPTAQGQRLLAIARIEPENNTEMILAAAKKAAASIVFVGNWDGSEYGRNLRQTYGSLPGFDLRSAIYDQSILAEIRAQSTVYVHGHSVGGTNPSLVEAIFASDRILAFDCAFNRATLDDEGAYFASADALADLLSQPQSGAIDAAELNRLRGRYRWSEITRQYLQAMSA